MTGVGGDGGPAEIARLMLEAATGARSLSPSELQEVLEHVGRAGFDPNARERVRGALAGMAWQGKILKGSDRISPAERHYLRHVLSRQEWPGGTTLVDYVESIRGLILDPTSGVLAHRYLGAWQIGILRESRDLLGPGGHPWVLVEYRVTLGHWVTAFQPEDGLDELRKPQWGDVRWLRRLRRRNVLPSS